MSSEFNDCKKKKKINGPSVAGDTCAASHIFFFFLFLTMGDITMKRPRSGRLLQGEGGNLFEYLLDRGGSAGEPLYLKWLQGP